MLNKSFVEMGIPPGYGIKQLLFSPVADALIVQAESGASNWRPERLYFRRTSFHKYEPIGEPDELDSQETPVVHPSKPLIAFNCLKHIFTIDAQGDERHGGDWHSLKIFNLELCCETDSISRETLRFPADVVKAWITGLVSFSDRGLFVSAGLLRPSSRVDYFLAEVDPQLRSLLPIAPLAGVFL
jgi:hypothetical protein